VLGAFPKSALAFAGVALFLACSATWVVDSLALTLAVSHWDAHVQLFVHSLAWKTVAPSDALLLAVSLVNEAASLSASLATILVDSVASARDGTNSLVPPVSDDDTLEGAFTGVRSELGALTAYSAICATGTGTYVLLAAFHEQLWIHHAVAVAEQTVVKV